MTNMRYEFIGAVFVKCSMFDMKRSSKVFFSVQGCFESKERSFLILDGGGQPSWLLSSFDRQWDFCLCIKIEKEYLAKNANKYWMGEVSQVDFYYPLQDSVLIISETFNHCLCIELKYPHNFLINTSPIMNLLKKNIWAMQTNIITVALRRCFLASEILSSPQLAAQ